MLAFDFVGDGTAVAVGARPIDESLLDQAASQRIELGHTARAGDGAAADAAVGLDGEEHADAPTDACFAQVTRIISRGDFAGDLLEVGSTFIRAITISACAPAGA